MKLIQSFNDFLNNEVNLNQTRLDRAKNGISVVSNFLRENELFKQYYISVSPQGSYRQKTIIKPVTDEDEFDVDILFQLKSVDGWEPKDYLNNLHAEFKKSDRYKDIVDKRGKTRCVTLDYADDFHIDIVPCVQRGGLSYIMNKKDNTYELTDADGYANWFSDKNSITGENQLIKVVRLFKYIRDYQRSFTVKSVVLTTLIGNQITAIDSGSDMFQDVPTSLNTLFNRFDNYLQSNITMPAVYNPCLPSENFNRHWDQDKYSVFRKNIHSIREKINLAFDEDDRKKSAEKWAEIFGDKFPQPVQKTDSNALSYHSPYNDWPAVSEDFIERYGIRYDLQYQLKINSHVHQNGFRGFNLRGTKNPLCKEIKLEFFVEKNTTPPPYNIKWKVKNRGEQAQRLNALRGEITDDNGTMSKVEHTRYRGVHYVECYVIKGKTCVARDSLDVPIQ
ncbi:MAG TPA: nucleotidyltransferase [Spirochaetota bacterium]|nr:nucleotidyltransferase [Spirochaetota bacterium]